MRVYRAACPQCGAPVEFASAASASAVCGFCRSTLLRDGETLRRIGVSAELFDDHSPLQLGAAGRYQGVPFTLVGRLQYGYADGSWNEWHALFQSDADTAQQGEQKSGWLSEDNGAYVLAFDAPPLGDAPAADELHPGERRLLAGSAWSVASVQRSHLIAAEGELPRPPRLDGEFAVADLRNEAGEVATLDYAEPAAPLWSVGRAVALSELAMTGLKEGSEKTLSARSLECPNCGAPLKPTLQSTRSIVCDQCKAVVDIAAGAGAELAHYTQNNQGPNGTGPQIPLGRSGKLALGGEGPLDWQVVGYQERIDIPEAGDEDEASAWSEYLLYHRTAGFAFLVDAEDGWSWVRPLTGAPLLSGSGATWQDMVYRQRYSYAARVTWVQGEFYWQVRRDEQAQVTDFDGPGGRKLSREQTGSEVVWSAGQAMDAGTVARAFKLTGVEAAAMQRDVAPVSRGIGGLSQGVIVLVVVVLVMLAMSRCGSGGDDCDKVKASFGASSNEYQQCRRNASSGGLVGGVGGGVGGGSFGGYSSGGGGHK
ncbi:MAG TPA: DUF4178 domain-containing protein [Ideonella sp.]|nr:DUF4178 domain-containing protein [Ideonella sp.]